MLSKNNHIQRAQLEMVTLDQLVPPDHLVRKMEAALDFSFAALNLKKLANWTWNGPVRA